jgi:hypothetical protein
MNKKFILSLALATLFGILIAWIDSQPDWDDAGITALFILSAAALSGFLAAKKPWLIAFSTGIWIPLSGIIYSGNYGGFLAIIPALIGAYGGYFIRKI